MWEIECRERVRHSLLVVYCPIWYLRRYQQSITMLLSITLFTKYCLAAHKQSRQEQSTLNANAINNLHLPYACLVFFPHYGILVQLACETRHLSLLHLALFSSPRPSFQRLQWLLTSLLSSWPAASSICHCKYWHEKSSLEDLESISLFV